MRKSSILLAACGIFIAMAAAVPVSAQKKTGDKELTIEELFLKSVEFQIVREKAFSEDFDMKMSALDDLDKKINDGSVGDNAAQVEFVLEYLSMEGTARMVRENKRQINYFPEVRRRAANMLGKLGTPEAQKALINVLLGDDEPMVKAEAAYGLGTIGLNDNNETTQALAFAFDKEDPGKPDNNYAFAVALAMEKLGKKSGGVKDPAAYRTLVKIAQGNYIRSVKLKAMQVLDSMKNQ
jgi:HEAT repeat protein